jgi:RNA polymerase sigma-70 factor (ECF subfamily)
MGDDRALLTAWHEGDQAAGEQLFGRHFDAVCRFFATKVGDGVDDLVQRTFLACLEKRAQWPEGVPFRPYLFGIARNVLRRRLREKEYAGRRFDMLESSAADGGASPASVADGRRETNILVRALQQLPVDLQIAIELRFWEGMSAAQVASVLGIPEGTAKTRLRRARQLLEEAIAAATPDAALVESVQGDLEAWAAALKDRLRSARG